MNHRIALYLSGKYPGSFTTPDKLLFMDSLQAISGREFSDDKIKMFWMFWQVDEYEFYLSFLNKVQRSFPDNYIELLYKLKIPSDIIGKSEGVFDHDAFMENLIAVEKITQSQSKWKAFEDFLKNMFDKIEWLSVLDIKQEDDEQIDVIVKNNINRPFWIGLQSSIILIEAKNWSTSTPTATLNTLRWKIGWHKNFARIWIVVALKWFTSEVDKNLVRDWSSDNIIVPINWDDIKAMLQGKEDPVLRLENKLTDAFK